MEKARWNKIEAIFNEAISLPEGERTPFMERSCLPDLELYEEVVSLVNAETLESAFLNSNAFTLGAKVLSDCKLPETEIFADYRLIKLLGRGGMGLVFLAEDTRLKRLVAVKLLTSALWESNDSESRFRQEAQAASHVSHQNIAHVYEYGEYEGQHFLAMEYVRGQTLREILKEGPVDREKTIDIVIQILEAVSAAHRQGIIHRDIKPENIIVSEDGLVKVLDFGLAKQTIPSNSDRNTGQSAIVETVPGIIVGTAGYMSPEQVRGQPTDERTDLWSVGVVLYELLAGLRPFTGATSSDVHASILRDDIPVVFKWPKSLQNILIKALQKDPSERFQAATEFSQEIQSVNSGSRGKLFSSRRWPIRKMSLRMVPIYGAVLLLGVIALFFLNKLVNPSTPGMTESSQKQAKITSLVILPFTVKGDPAKSEVLTQLSYDWSYGLTDSIGSANVCLVKSLNSAYQMKEVKNAAFIRDKLSVDTILKGSITSNPGSIHVEVELVDANSEKVLWQDELDADHKQLFDLRNRLFSLISTNLQVFLSKEKRFFTRLPDFSPRPDEEKAYALYLRGRYEYDDSIDNQKARISYLREAVKLSPGFSLAYLALAQNLSGGTENDVDSVETYALAASGSEVNNFSQAHLILGRIFMEKGDWVNALREFGLARSANPNDAQVRYWYGQTVLPSLGRFNEALSEMEIAFKINPLSSYYETSRADIKLLARDYEGALGECDNFRERFPRSPITFSSCRAIPLAKLGRFDEAIEAANVGAEVSNEILGISIQAIVYALTGQSDAARQFTNNLEERRRQGNTTVSPYRLAAIYAVLGDRENALVNLKETAQSEEKLQLLFLRFESAFDSLRNDPGFVEIEKRFAVPDDINLEL